MKTTKDTQKESKPNVFTKQLYDMTKAEIKKQQNELIDLMLKKAGISREDIYQTAIRSWVNKNLDLLTKSELKKYNSILMQ